MSLQGSAQLRARLKAIKETWKPLGRAWAKDTYKTARPMVPSRTGRLRRSIRVLGVSAKRARVGAHHTAYFVDKGPKAHTIKAKRGSYLIFQSGGRTVFTRQVHHRGYRGRPFRRRAAIEGLRKNPLAVAVINQWNDAA